MESNKDQEDKNIVESVHKTVLLNEAIEGLKLHSGMIFFDGTLGGGGHSEKVCRDFNNKVKIIAVDKDSGALERASQKIKKAGCEANLVLSNFRDIDKVLNDLKIKGVDAILFDLGLSSDQFESSGRGFSFRFNEPLLMTFSADGNKEEINAGKIVNNWSEETLADILFGYADEKYARRIARAIVEVRDTKPIMTTFDLVEIIKKAVPGAYTRGKIHFATKTFQALRIAVNDEIESLKIGLKKGFEVLNKGGRFAVISFHSTEDRVVKIFYKEKKAEGKAVIITKKPIIPNDEEIKLNSRSRSAKLRILEKK